MLSFGFSNPALTKPFKTWRATLRRSRGRRLPFYPVHEKLEDAASGSPQMKRLLILLLSICALVLAVQFLARAQGVSYGIPLPIPFLFVNFGPTCYAQPNYGSAYHPLPYYAQPVGYYRPAYHWACLYERGWSGYYDPNYCGCDP